MKTDKNIGSNVMEPFSTSVIDLLDRMAQKIFNKKIHKAELYPIGFYCRRANLLKLKEQYSNRLPCGTVLFICPKNVDVLSCYAVVFGMITGNYTIIRPSNSDLFQTFIEILFDCIKELGFSKILNCLRFLEPQKQSELEFWSQQANVRIAWGGNDSIKHYASMQTSVDCRDVFFAHRDSLAIIDCDKIDNTKEVSLMFWKCAYSFEQASCSSPRIVYFLNSNQNIIDKFWNEVASIARQQSSFCPINMMDKYYYICRHVSKHPSNTKMYGNYVYTIEGSNVNQYMEVPLGWGTFITFNVSSISECLHWPSQLQTIAYYGINKEDIWNELLKSNNTTITRIVPFNKVLEFNHIVDGTDIIERLTRQIVLD